MITIACRPSTCACFCMWLIRNWCPRCTPSKKPIVATQAVVFAGMLPSTYMVFIAHVVNTLGCNGYSLLVRQSYEETVKIARKTRYVLPFSPCRLKVRWFTAYPCRDYGIGVSVRRSLYGMYHVRDTMCTTVVV